MEDETETPEELKRMGSVPVSRPHALRTAGSVH